LGSFDNLSVLSRTGANGKPDTVCEGVLVWVVVCVAVPVSVGVCVVDCDAVMVIVGV